MRRRTVELHIAQLVLHGIAPGDRAALGLAVEKELTRLLAAPGALDALGQARAVGRLDGGTIRIGAGSTAADLGQAVGRAALRGLTT
jgi:hypothetical protein